MAAGISAPDHGQLCKVIETQTLWGDTTCRIIRTEYGKNRKV